MYEFVKVLFPTKREVRVDDRGSGFTNKTFQVETGTHTFDLGPEPANYSPDEQTLVVDGTLPEKPMIITFEEI